jgi:hypothetical protein
MRSYLVRDHDNDINRTVSAASEREAAKIKIGPLAMCSRFKVRHGKCRSAPSPSGGRSKSPQGALGLGSLHGWGQLFCELLLDGQNAYGVTLSLPVGGTSVVLPTAFASCTCSGVSLPGSRGAPPRRSATALTRKGEGLRQEKNLVCKDLSDHRRSPCGNSEAECFISALGTPLCLVCLNLLKVALSE